MLALQVLLFDQALLVLSGLLITVAVAAEVVHLLLLLL